MYLRKAAPFDAAILPLPAAPAPLHKSVSHNLIKAWTLDVSGLRKMRHMRLKGVGLDQCPQGIERLNKLENLDLSDNRIKKLEQSTASMFKLKKLNLSGNNIPVRGCIMIPAVSLRIFYRFWGFHGRLE